MNDDSTWPCWACSREIDGVIYQAFSLTERWKGKPEREGSYTRVALCLDCARRVMKTLYAIQDEATARPATGELGGEGQ